MGLPRHRWHEGNAETGGYERLHSFHLRAAAADLRGETFGIAELQRLCAETMSVCHEDKFLRLEIGAREDALAQKRVFFWQHQQELFNKERMDLDSRRNDRQTNECKIKLVILQRAEGTIGRFFVHDGGDGGTTAGKTADDFRQEIRRNRRQRGKIYLPTRLPAGVADFPPRLLEFVEYFGGAFTE